MNAARWREVEAVLDAALDTDPAHWPRLLDERCGADAELRSEVERLLRHKAGARTFLASPPAAVAASFIAETQGAARHEGRRIGAWRVAREIGHGGTARVYLAERDDGQFTQHVALKLLRPGLDTDADQGRFRAERQILATLNHPGIARLLDGGMTPEGLPWLAMELVEGQPIDAWCAVRALSVRERLRLFLSVCDATRYAHRNLVVHRDLKPSNIFVTADAQVKLLDFGLARLLEPQADDRSTTRSTQWMTPEYAAPEQIRGEPATTLTDVYQLGVVLYELLTGALPFGKRGAPDLAHDILHAEPPLPSSRAPRGTQLRGDIDAIVLKAIRREPEQRYASVDAFASDVERFLGGQPVLARQGSTGYRARRFVRRHRAGVAAAAVIALLLVGYAATVSVHNRRIAASLASVEQEKIKAEATALYLMGLFSPYGAGFGPRDTLTAARLIARGVRDVDELAGRPLAQAQLLGVLGTILRGMYEYPRADSLLTRALALRVTNLGPDHVDVAESMFQLALLAQSRSDYRRARELLAGAYAIQRERLGEAHPATSDTRLRLSLIGTPIDERVASDREALAIARGAYGDESAQVAEALLRLGMTLRGKGMLDSSEALLRASLALRRRVAPGDQFNVTRTVAQLATLRLQQGAVGEAERLQREVLASQEARNGPDHVAVGGALRTLAATLVAEGKLAEAESLVKRDMAIRERAYGTQHVEYGSSAAVLANVLRAQGRLAEAESSRRHELATLRATYGERDVVLAGSMSHLADLLMDQGRLDEAERLLVDGTALREAVSGAESPPVATMLVPRARLARLRGDHAAADTLLRRSFTILKDWGLLDAQADVQQAHREAVRLYDAWGKPELAATHRKLVIAHR